MQIMVSRFVDMLSTNVACCTIVRCCPDNALIPQPTVWHAPIQSISKVHYIDLLEALMELR